jgi:hypothetical protein
MTRKQGKEAALRDYIANHIENLPELIGNLSRYRSGLEKKIQHFLADDYEDFGPLPHHLIHRILQKRARMAVTSLSCLKLVDIEVPLLSTHKAGYQPSADILAVNFEDGTLFLLEIKQAVGTEREMGTELAAYSHGLQQRLWGLAPCDHVWIPISTEWRTMPQAAIANESIFSHRIILPLRCKNIWSGSKLLLTRLQILDLIPLLDEPLCLSLFAWDCFDCYYIAIKKAPIEPQHFLQFIASTGNRLGLSGFTLFCSSNIPGALSYDYGIIICVFNPIRGAFKRKQLELVRKYSGKRRMRMETKNSLWHGFDFDLRTGKIRELTGEESEKKKGGTTNRLLI